MWGWLGTECSTVRVIRVVAQSNYEELHDTASAAKCFPCCGCCMLFFSNAVATTQGQILQL
jgi:hypothetical protein